MALALVRPETLYAWRGPSLFIASTRGECGGDQPISGFYHREARYLHRLALRVNDEAPWLCEASAPAPDVLTFLYVFPEIQQPGGGGTGQAGDEEHSDRHGLPERSLDLQTTFRVTCSRLDITLEITNRARIDLTFDLSCVVDADFADIQEALSGQREQRGAVAREADSGLVCFRYSHPALHYRTEIHHQTDWIFRDGALHRRVTLHPRQTQVLTIAVVPIDPEGSLTDADVAARDEAMEQWRQSFSRMSAPGNRAIEEVVSRNVRDFASFPLMTGPREEWLCPQAGMPLYPAFFGRDALTAGWQAASLDGGQSLDAALIRLGRLQSRRFDAWHDGSRDASLTR
jgi:N-terminal domain of (some) glycogen debranching enzymes